MTETDAVTITHLPLPGRRQGKVRDVYELPGHAGSSARRLLIVATDRISAFDVIMPTPIPGKGALLTDISVKWFDLLRSKKLIGDHLLSTDADRLDMLSVADREMLRGRVMICRAVQIVPVECVARGYLAGSGWTEYQESGRICGVAVKPGLKQGDEIPGGPIFTPATKETSGHDINIGFEAMAASVGGPLAERLRSLTLAIYKVAAAHARAHGLILADTKFEFGFALDAEGNPTDELLLADEVLTPDSTRYWPKENWTPGREQESFDKQFLREYLLGLVRTGTWDRNPPGPELPQEIVAKTYKRYVEARERLFPPGA